MAHHNTVFGQLLTLLPRHEFDAEARDHQRGQRLRVMSRWAQFVALGLGQLASRQSLRDIVSNLRAQPAKLYHLGVPTVSRSSLARVNAEQPYTLYEALFGRLLMTWSRWFGQLEGLVKVYSDCESTPSSSSAPALTGGCHGWHEAGSYPVIDDDDALWNCGNLAAGAQAWAAALAREISNGLWVPASPPSGFSATVSGRPQAGQVHSAGWDMVLGPLMR